MATTVTEDQVIQGAAELGKEEFTRPELADKLGVKISDLKDAFKAARQSGRMKKIGENDDGKGIFSVPTQ